DAAGFRAKLVEVAHAALLAPRLFLRLRRAIDLLRLILPQSLGHDRAGRLSGRREILSAARRDGEISAEDAHAQVGVVDVLPSHVLRRVAAEQPALDTNEATARCRDEHSPVREREEAPLDGVRDERLAGDEERLQMLHGLRET